MTSEHTLRILSILDVHTTILEDRRCACNLILGRDGTTIVPVEKQNLSVCICSLGYQSVQCACVMKLSVACLAVLYFLHYPIKGMIFGKHLPNTKLVY
jgi:hypothetical protein